MAAFVENLELLAARDLKKLQAVCGVTPSAYIAQLAEFGYRCHMLDAGGRLGAPVVDMPPGPDVISVAFVRGT